MSKSLKTLLLTFQFTTQTVKRKSKSQRIKVGGKKKRRSTLVYNNRKINVEYQEVPLGHSLSLYYLSVLPFCKQTVSQSNDLVLNTSKSTNLRNKTCKDKEEVREGRVIYSNGRWVNDPGLWIFSTNEKRNGRLISMKVLRRAYVERSKGF